MLVIEMVLFLQDFLKIFLILFWLHCLFDFSFQSEFMSKYKGKHWFVMLVHVTAWVGPMFAAMKYFGNEATAVLTAFLFITHYFADWYKIKLIKKSTGEERIRSLFLSDQLFHAATLAFVALPMWY